MENGNHASTMAFLPLKAQTKKRTQVVAIDLGARATKAVSLLRRGTGFDLLRYTIQDAPVHEKNPSLETIGAHLRTVVDALGAKTKQVIVMLGVNDSLLRQAELPLGSIDDMRLMMKFNSKAYLQQDLPDHVFDCYILPPRAHGKDAEALKPSQKCRVLVGGVKKQLLEQVQSAVKLAGLTADEIAPAQIATANAFEMAQPEIFQKEVVALVDIGFKNSSINILEQGALALSRVVAIGADRITSGLAEALNVGYGEAEGIKVGMPDQVQSAILPLLTPLGRELRASIDFFEHQQDKAVSQVFISGGSARSVFIIETLQSELMVPCQAWNPVSFLNNALAPDQAGELEQVAPQLAVAAGGAVAAF
jgi:type IV pilus assembly protein PilM